MIDLNEIPHLRVPFEISGASALTTNQDTAEEVEQNVRVIVGTRRGERLVVPTFGIEDPTFETTIDTAEIEQQVAEFEPRAELSFDYDDSSSEHELTILVRS